MPGDAARWRRRRRVEEWVPATGSSTQRSGQMLNGAKAFSGFAVDDVGRAREF
jgi:hypothetical protein